MGVGLLPSIDKGEGLYKVEVTGACSGKGFLRTLGAWRGGEVYEEEIEAAGEAATGGEDAMKA